MPGGDGVAEMGGGEDLEPLLRGETERARGLPPREGQSLFGLASLRALSR